MAAPPLTPWQSRTVAHWYSSDLFHERRTAEQRAIRDRVDTRGWDGLTKAEKDEARSIK